MKKIKMLTLTVLCLTLVSSISFASWVFDGYINLEPSTNSADSAILPISMAIDSAGDIYYSTFNATGVATTCAVWKISNPLTSPSFTALDLFPGMVNQRGFGYISIDKTNNKLYTATEGGSNATDRIHKVDLNDPAYALDSSWGGGDGEILGSDAVVGNTRVNTAIVTNTGEIIVGRLVGTTTPFTIVDSTGTVNNGVCSALPWSGLNPRDFAFDPVTNDVYATQNGRITKWTGGTATTAASYVATDSTQEASVSVAGEGITIDTTNSANPIIYYSNITTTLADGGYYFAKFASDLSADNSDTLGTGAGGGDGTGPEISRPSDAEVWGGRLYAIDYDRVNFPPTWRRIVYYHGASVPVELSGFEAH